MARQKVILKFEGTVGDLIFYNPGDEYFIRSKNNFNPAKSSDQSKEDSAELSRASRGSKLIRKGLHPFIHDHRNEAQPFNYCFK